VRGDHGRPVPPPMGYKFVHGEAATARGARGDAVVGAARGPRALVPPRAERAQARRPGRNDPAPDRGPAARRARTVRAPARRVGATRGRAARMARAPPQPGPGPGGTEDEIGRASCRETGETAGGTRSPRGATSRM